MLIRSQDKKSIFDMTASNIEIGIKNEILGYGNSFGDTDIPTVLGRYLSEQRAIEVLDEICNAYISLNKSMGKEYRGNNPSGYFGGYVKNGVFQMPEV